VSGFLARWSRRKRGEEAEPPAPAEPAAPPPAAAEPEFDPASLPPLESLGSGSDLSAFLHPKVPALLRQAALRRVWSADPGIRDFVGPADYAWDFNAPDGVPGFALNLGGADIKKLLAQAIGDVTAPDEATEEQQAAPPEIPAIPEPLRLEEPAPVVVAAVEQDSTLPEPEELPRTRRHGGAMPMLPGDQAG